MPPVKAVLFDMDGTLIDSKDVGFALFNRGREHFGQEPVGREEFDRVVWGCPFEEERCRFFPGVDPEALLAFYAEHFPEEAGRIRLMDGALEVLDVLDERGIRCALVTNTHRSLALPGLERTGLAGRFATMVFGDDAPHGKPAPDLVLLACRRLGIAPTDALFVGDTVMDVQAGEAASVTTLCLGPHGEHLIAGLGEVLGYIER